MSYQIAGIDESQRPSVYLMCAAIASTSDINRIRQTMRTFLLPNQRRLHAKKESPGRRRTLLKCLTEMGGFTCVVLVGQARDARDRPECLGTLAGYLLDCAVRELVLERIDPGTMRRDQYVVQTLSRQRTEEFSMRHEQPDKEPLLWIADLVAYAYCAGGEVRKATEPVVSAVLRLEEPPYRSH